MEEQLQRAANEEDVYDKLAGSIAPKVTNPNPNQP